MYLQQALQMLYTGQKDGSSFKKTTTWNKKQDMQAEQHREMIEHQVTPQNTRGLTFIKYF